MKKETCMIIKNSLTGEQIKIPSVEDINVNGRNAIIEAFTQRLTEHDIGYYVSYMYEQ